MGVKSHKAWTDAEEVFLIEHHGTMHNRELAKRLGREVYAIENRVARLRKAGLMRSAPKEPKWTEADDRELMACYQSLTSAMLAERFGRSKGAIDTRIRRLRERGWKIDAVPSGRGRQRQAEQARAEYKVPDLSLETDRQVLRDEIAKYLKAEIEAKRMDMDRARKIVDKLKASVIAAPPNKLARYLAMPVARIVSEAA